MKTKIFAVVMGMFVLGILAGTGTVLAEELKVRQPTQSEIGKMVNCPVMNIKFEVAKNTPVVDYKGRTYYFCCENCLKDFKANPDKYATPATESQPSQKPSSP
jgi:YHS domain-containing protein